MQDNFADYFLFVCFIIGGNNSFRQLPERRKWTSLQACECTFPSKLCKITFFLYI